MGPYSAEAEVLCASFLLKRILKRLKPTSVTFASMYSITRHVLALLYGMPFTSIRVRSINCLHEFQVSAYTTSAD